jgi:hypothetical protein
MARVPKVGDRVRINYRIGDPKFKLAFDNRPGMITEASRDGSTRMYRVKFDSPARVEGLDPVESDLFPRNWLVVEKPVTVEDLAAAQSDEAGRLETWIRSILTNDEASSDTELVEHFVNEGGLDRTVAQLWVSKRSEFLKAPLESGSIPAPDPVPAPEKKDPKRESEMWCKCGSAWTFGTYPQDGECECGIKKHHVHCGNCGKVSQIG